MTHNDFMICNKVLHICTAFTEPIPILIKTQNLECENNKDNVVLQYYATNCAQQFQFQQQHSVTYVTYANSHFALRCY